MICQEKLTTCLHTIFTPKNTREETGWVWLMLLLFCVFLPKNRVETVQWTSQLSRKERKTTETRPDSVLFSCFSLCPNPTEAQCTIAWFHRLYNQSVWIFTPWHVSTWVHGTAGVELRKVLTSTCMCVCVCVCVSLRVCVCVLSGPVAHGMVEPCLHNPGCQGTNWKCQFHFTLLCILSLPYPHPST